MQKYFAFLTIVGLVGCGDGSDGGGGGGGDLSFQDMCDQGAAKMCEKAQGCGSIQPTAECIAQGKAMNCLGGVEQFCGVGMTFQSSKVSACMAALDGLACADLNTVPAACTPETLCASQGGTPPITSPGEACTAVSDSSSCDARAALCYAAGTSSSCANKALCVGDGTGMNCAATCAVDADCLSAGTGLVCLQGCAVAILNGYCVTPKAKAKFAQRTCSELTSSSASGIAGWSL